MASENSPITFVTKEGDRVQSISKFKNLSILVKNVIEDCEQGEDIPIAQVSTNMLNRILEYAQHHDFIPPEPLEKPLKTSKIEEILSDPWDVEFLKSFDDDGLADLMFALNYLDVACLMEICFAYIATKFRGKDPNQIRAEYGIEEEFTREEDEKIKRENPWTQDEAIDRVS
ncbi:unnamed protein product [Blepharisma stoltei]|uniref:SKP1-like protein n=1 Tax=Blepharisma stoltei TaxID=1481888 RepID=A0AAU9IH79_9CILI|nr:unnamed protein product [Blepharisma stoltei]